MHLTDLIPEEDLKKLQQELHDQYGMNADVMDADGHKLYGATWGNELCPALHEDDKGFGAICVPAGQMFIHLAGQGEPFAEYCDGNMMRVSVPVVVDGEVLGSIGGCGLVPADDEVDEFTIGMMSGLSEDDISTKAATVKAASEERVQEIIAFITERIGALKQ